MTIDTEWMPVSVEPPEAAIDCPHLYGVWMQLAGECWKRRTGGRIENARSGLDQSVPKRSFLMSWGINEDWIPWLLVDCEFWEWEGDALVLVGYPADEERKLVERKKLAQEYGRKGAGIRWNDKVKERTGKADRKRELEPVSPPKARSNPPARGMGFNDALGEVVAKLEKPTPATEAETAAFLDELHGMIAPDKPPP